MALVKYGEMISYMSGSVNGTTHSRNKAGAYMRNRSIPSNPQSLAQTAVRNRLAGNSQDWRGLTEAERDAWNGSAPNFPSINVFGDVRELSGNSLFVGLNNNLQNVGAGSITVPPAPTGADALATLSVTASTGPDLVTVAYTPDPVPVSHSLVINCTANISAGINNFKNKLRQISIIAPAAASPADITAAYTARFGALSVGMKIGISAKLVNRVTGEVSQILKASTIIT